MKASLLLTLLTVATTAHAQGTFRNLDFESANISPLAPGQFEYVSISNGMPGWNSSITVQGYLIGHNGRSLGGPDVEIEGPQLDPMSILFGNYSAYLVGQFAPPGPVSASIWQTGVVPQNARSLFFLSNPSTVPLFQVTLGSVSIPVTEMGSTTQYSIWAGDISQFAGLTEQLTFTALPGNGGFLDQITFSPNPVPEPSAAALACLAGPALAWRMWQAGRKKPKRLTG